MSKKRNRAGRETSDFARTLVLPRPLRLPSNPLTDLRMWHPAPAIRPALSFFGRPAQLRLARPKTRQTRSRLTFYRPASIDVCSRRSRRRQVMFAKGFGGRFYKPRYRNQFSSVSCKR